METEDRRMETSQMRSLRSAIRITVRDKIKSEKIREQLKTNRTAEHVLQEYENSWHGYGNFCAKHILTFLLENEK
jgi:hypothetical protein